MHVYLYKTMGFLLFGQSGHSLDLLPPAAPICQ